jgi:hypothetical protein
MKNIRQGIFETNSSSSHSISISKDTDGVLGTLFVDDDGIVHLDGGEFGWEEETYYGSLIKANYCAIDTEHSPEYRKMLVKVICEHTGAKDVAFDFSPDWDHENYSYIDHQSQGTSHEAFADEETLKMFIFNRNSYLHTDNDNH